MSKQAPNTDRRAFLKGSIIASTLLGTSHALANAASTSPVAASAEANHKPVAGPVKIVWIKIIKDGNEPKRVFYQAQSTSGSQVTNYYHYFNLTTDTASQVGLLAASMADQDGTAPNVYYTGDTGVNVNYSSGDKTATASGPAGPNPAPKYPATGTLNSHENVKDIRNQATKVDLPGN